MSSTILTLPPLDATTEELAAIIKATSDAVNDDLNAASIRWTDLDSAIYQRRQTIKRLNCEIEQLQRAKLDARHTQRTSCYQFSAWLTSIRDRYPADRLPDNVYMFKLQKLGL